MKFKLRLKDHPNQSATIKIIESVQINEKGEELSATDVGYIENSCAKLLKFKEMSD